MSHLQFLNRLKELGAEFGVGVPNQWGATTYSVTPEELIEFESDPTAFYAKKHGVTKNEFTLWVNSDFHVYCSGTTTKGKRCRNIAVGGSNVDAKKWVSMQGEYCPLHGEGNN